MLLQPFTEIDLSQYARRAHFEYFCSLQYPYVGVTNNVDVTELVRFCGENGSIEEEEDRRSMYFISTLPWLHYTALIQPVAGGEESNPRITWGRFQEDGRGRLQLPVTLLAHHALADGIHLAMFYQNLERVAGEIANG